MLNFVASLQLQPLVACSGLVQLLYNVVYKRTEWRLRANAAPSITFSLADCMSTAMPSICHCSSQFAIALIITPSTCYHV